MRCRGRADCRPGRMDHSERGKRPGGAGSLVAARQGPMPADAAAAWRSPRSSPSRGKPGTWRRRTAGRRREKPFGRSGVNTSAPLDAKQAEERVLGWQTKLHRWAGEDREKRFGDLFNLVCDPATLLVAWERVKRNRGSRTAGVDGITRERIERQGVQQFLDELRQSLRERLGVRKLSSTCKRVGSGAELNCGSSLRTPHGTAQPATTGCDPELLATAGISSP